MIGQVLFVNEAFFFVNKTGNTRYYYEDSEDPRVRVGSATSSSSTCSLVEREWLSSDISYTYFPHQ